MSQAAINLLDRWIIHATNVNDQVLISDTLKYLRNNSHSEHFKKSPMMTLWIDKFSGIIENDEYLRLTDQELTDKWKLWIQDTLNDQRTYYVYYPSVSGHQYRKPTSWSYEGSKGIREYIAYQRISENQWIETKTPWLPKTMWKVSKFTGHGANVEPDSWY